MRDDDMLGMAMRFHVVVDGVDLGGWASCKGLGVTFVNEDVEPGGVYEYAVILPGRLQYSTITLERAMSAGDSARLQAWLRQVVTAWYRDENADDYPGVTAQIVLLDARNDRRFPVASWSLRNVYPKSWKGPDLDATSGNVAVETLELAHQGFL
ncbi:phage tail protein [Streptomyces sp. TRM72054]|uniref:phage tail protein n=1 Tax=Streptomyces sp. TRM72054 TaxID=2870562 RepID=UPI001C8B1F1E|nr:phage tail protein [Streptomyces sp. TRM72054]MBX9394360.1 phage tail protein [Streptomyces sp. TRM72054]